MSAFEKVVEVRGLAVRYPEATTCALEGIDLSLVRGRCHALVGESGSGKSTLALALSALLPAGTQVLGDVRIAGVPLSQRSPAELRRVRGGLIGWCFQDAGGSLDPRLRVERQLCETIGFQRRTSAVGARAKARSLLAEVGIADVERCLRAFPHELSGGLQRRVALALALSGDPEVLVADEPTSALDTVSQRVILALITKRCRERNMAVLLITHDLGLASEWADDLSVLRAGRVVEHGPRAALVARPTSRYLQELLAVRHRAPQRRVEVAPSPALMSVLNLSLARHSGGMFGGRAQWVLQDVTLQVPRGRTLGLIGESGSGKTTLAHALLGLLRPTRGSVECDGEPVASLRGAALTRFRRRVQYVAQDPFSALNPRMTVGEALMEPMVVHGLGSSARERRARAIALLDEVGLDTALFERLPEQLSGGQRQRVSIARGLAISPELLICDEPVAQLDPLIADQVLSLLQRLQEQRGLGYVLISHDLSVIARMAHEAVVLKGGAVVEQGATVNLLHAPQHPYTAALTERWRAEHSEESAALA